MPIPRTQVKKLLQEVFTLYLDAVDPGQDDFRELSSLLFGAKERSRSVRTIIRHTVDAAVAEEANRRFVDWRFEQPSGSGMGILRTEEEHCVHGPDVPQHFYLVYENIKEMVHLWHEKPDRWREEILASRGQTRRCMVFGGEEGPRWIYEPPETVIYDPVGTLGWWPREDPRTEFSFMLDPSEALFSYALLDDAAVHKSGRRTTVASRETVEVRVRTVSWGYPPRIFHGIYAPKGTTDHLLLVDEEVGTILRVAARLEGREFYVAEATEIAYDENFPEDTFRLEIPGVEFRQVDR